MLSTLREPQGDSHEIRKMQKLAIYGAGGQGREVLQLIRAINGDTPQWEVIGWLDDGIPKGTVIAGLPVLGGTAEANTWATPLALTIAIGWSATKRKVIEQLTNNKLYYPVLIHPSVAIESKELQVGEGTVIQAGNLLTVNVTIGKHVLVNLGCTLAHDSVVGDFVGLMPSVNVSGEVTIGEGTYIGTGTQILQQKSIGAHTVIGAGAVVTEDIPPHCTAVGIPAKPIKFHQ